MPFTLRKPILVGGLGLSLSIGLLEILHPASGHWSSLITWGAVAIGSGFWWLKQQTQKPIDFSARLQPIDRTAVEQAIAQVETVLDHLNTEAADSLKLAPLRSQLAQLQQELDRNEIRFALVGGKSSGKTALKQQLVASALPKGADLPTQFSISDTPALFTETSDRAQAIIAPVAQNSDLLLFVTAGDLTLSEFELIQQWVNQKQRVLLVFNKQDQYLPTDRPAVLQQLRQRVQDFLAPEDVVAIAANPAPFKVRQIQEDGTTIERQEQPAPDLAPLTTRLAQVLTAQGQPLVYTTVQRQATALKQSVIAELNLLRRDRTLPLIEQAQWIAAAAAFANPMPSLDLLATAAVNAQLIADIGGIYKQSFTIDQAKAAASAIASLMIKLGLVELSSQAIAPLLKSHALTYVAGGTLQGVSAAYLTRIAGLTLVEYFEEQSWTATPAKELQLDRLGEKLKLVFQANQRLAFLQGLVKQGIDRLAPSAAPALPAAEA
ncbi:DUF697 domain-containing protein [Microcoleus sp. FACHB-1515]|uniref:slr1306 family protein n=1 Tax=Cyanophyceae TaxID=3028117 RepID=UPI0016870DBB|nr:DUF697 domain-containing protein [Microcoleus sp. FACHB-1515]MBD2092926.1 DUF697 domain-containing protein [Microcoleus sp. FACHB-1515]